MVSSFSTGRIDHLYRDVHEESKLYLHYGDLTDRQALKWEDHVEIDPRYFRPAEIDLLLGDPSKARAKLGWTAATDLENLSRIMVEHDLELAHRELHDKSYTATRG